MSAGPLGIRARRLALRWIALLYLARDPRRAARDGLLPHVRERHRGRLGRAVTTPEALHAFKLTLIITAIAVPLNTVFGIVVALAIVRRRFPARACSTRSSTCRSRSRRSSSASRSSSSTAARAGSAAGSSEHDIQVLFALPAMVLATVFVSLPFVAREVVPTLREIGDEQEQAASTLGAIGMADASGGSRCRRSAGR